MRSEGIETALDVERDKILKVQNFGPTLTQRLLDWRNDVEKKFVFDATKGVPESEKQALAVKYFQLRQPLEKNLLDGEAALKVIKERFDTAHGSAVTQIRSLIALYGQAIADMRVIPSGA